MKNKKLVFLLFSLILIILRLVVEAQTIVSFTQQIDQYDQSLATSGSGNFYNGTSEIGMWMDGDNSSKSFAGNVLWKYFRVGSATSTTIRALQVGDEFTITVSTKGFYYGTIGVSLNSGTIPVVSWENRNTNSRIKIQQDGVNFGGGTPGSWYYSNGVAQAFNVIPTGSYVDYVMKVKLTAPDMCNITLNNNTTSDVSLGGTAGAPITNFSIYMSDDRAGIWNNPNRGDSYWKAVTQNQNTGNLTIGASNGTFTIEGVINNGLDANSTTVNSLNNAVTKWGNGRLTLSASNTYSGTTTVSAGTLELQGSLASSAVTVNDGAILRINGSAVTLSSLTVVGSGIVQILPGKSLTVTGTTTTNGGLVLKSPSDAGPSGSFLPTGTVTGSVTVERYISAWGVIANHGWHLLSSPVAAQAIDPNFINGTATNYDLYAWWEPTNQWVNYKNSSTAPTWNTANVLGVTSGAGNFIPGKGYLVAYAATDTKQFTGTLNNANIPISNLTINSGTNYGWHLLGNPFTCALTWGSLDWALSNIAATAKYWDESTAAYISLDANSGIIPAMNGFMVEATYATNSLTIPIAARVHAATAWYKSSGDPTIKLVAHDPSGQTAQESIIRFNAQATSGFDQKYDSHFLAGYAPLFYSVAGEEHLSTNALPASGGTVQVPFDFIKNDGTDFTIEAETISGIDGPVMLNDLKTGSAQDLTVNPVYTFTSSSADNASRFLLTFNHLGIGETPKTNPFTIYTSGNNILVLDNNGKNEGSAFVYNMMGQLIKQQTLSGNSMTKINMNSCTGYYVVKVITSGETCSSKIFLH